MKHAGDQYVWMKLSEMPGSALLLCARNLCPNPNSSPAIALRAEQSRATGALGSRYRKPSQEQTGKEAILCEDFRASLAAAGLGIFPGGISCNHADWHAVRKGLCKRCHPTSCEDAGSLLSPPFVLPCKLFIIAQLFNSNHDYFT
jgi:hypothetical protein